MRHEAEMSGALVVFSHLLGLSWRALSAACGVSVRGSQCRPLSASLTDSSSGSRAHPLHCTTRNLVTYPGPLDGLVCRGHEFGESDAEKDGKWGTSICQKMHLHDFGRYWLTREMNFTISILLIRKKKWRDRKFRGFFGGGGVFHIIFQL